MKNFGKVVDRSKIRILELGCGWGNNLSFLHNEGFDYYGIDFAKPAIDHCETFFSNVVCGDMSCMPYDNDHFECVFDRMSIQHNTKEDIELIFHEVFRTLKPGGQFFSITTSRANYDLFTTYLPKETLQLMLSKHTNQIKIIEVVKSDTEEVISKLNIVIAKNPC